LKKIYYVSIQNNGSLALTIQTGLGSNIKTTYSSVISVGPGGSALMTINIITLNAIQTTIVGVSVLT
jgi:anthranilate phosphoribosyltransferase